MELLNQDQAPHNMRLLDLSQAVIRRTRATTRTLSLPTPWLLGKTQNAGAPDHLANLLSYIEEDPSTTVVERSRDLKGYQCYVVEQWACSRKAPTIIIAAFTGDSSHTINVGILSVPSDEESWSPRLRIYFKALVQHNTKRKDTPLGALMVTNLSGFPSSLTIIPVTDGNVRKHRDDFFVNENLKRLGCAGRTGISLAPPSVPTQAKFHQLYRTSDKVGFYESVLELVRLCQVALILFGVLESEYADGLLCDVTERASRGWWAEVGLDLYGVEPVDGVLGPTTVAALLGTLIGARNRLHAYGTPVAKDVFEMESTKRAIASFQKSQRLHRTRRFDRHTLDKLHKVTSKQAAAESWAVPRAVKSTVAELSGKGGEMVMDMVRGRDKATLAEMETTDIDKFTQLVGGDRAKWLWLGKPLKRSTRDILADRPIDIVMHGKGEEHAEHLSPSAQLPADHGTAPKGKIKHQQRFRKKVASDPSEGHDQETQDSREKRNVFGRATGRLKGAVKPRDSERPKPQALSPTSLSHERHNRSLHSSDSEPGPHLLASPSKQDSFHDADYPDADLLRRSDHLKLPEYSHRLTETPVEWSFPESDDDEETLPDYHSYMDEQTSQDVSNQHDIADAIARETEMADGGFPIDLRPGQNVGLLLRSTRSFSKFKADSSEDRNETYWPRNLSFSAAEGAVLRWDSVDDSSRLDEKPRGSDAEHLDMLESTYPHKELERELLQAAAARRLRTAIARLGADMGTWILSQISAVEDLDTLAGDDLKQLTALSEPRSKRKDELAKDANDTLAEERNRLEDIAKDVATLGSKLEYELGALKSKVEDVEDSVAEFEKNVEYTYVES